MDDTLTFLAAVRARTTLETALGRSTQAEAAKMFRRAAWLMIRPDELAAINPGLAAEPDERVKALGAHHSSEPEFQNAAQELSAAYVASIAEQSALDSIARYARKLPESGLGRAIVASGSVGDIIAEGHPKIVRSLGLDIGTADPKKSVGAVVLTNELLRKGGREVLQMFETELVAAVTRGANRSILNMFSGATSVAGTGDPLEDLRVGLRAAGPSQGYVVLGDSGAVADLATRVENKGASVRGGEFCAGVSLVAMDGDLIGTSGPSLLVIPASRLTVWAGPIELRRSREASFDMSDTPSSPAVQVSLFQTGSHGLIVEREWRIGGDLSGAVLVG